MSAAVITAALTAATEAMIAGEPQSEAAARAAGIILRAGGGASTPAVARRRANLVAIASIATAVALVAGMVAAHVPQDRL